MADSVFPERLRALRTGRGDRLEDVASALNRSAHNIDGNLKGKKNTASQIGNWERGERLPTYIEVKKLAEYFDVSLDYLVGRDNVGKADLLKTFITQPELTFGDQRLNNQDRYELIQLIDGYLHGKAQRPDVPFEHSDELDLFGDNNN